MNTYYHDVRLRVRITTADDEKQMGTVMMSIWATCPTEAMAKGVRCLPRCIHVVCMEAEVNNNVSPLDDGETVG